MATANQEPVERVPRSYSRAGLGGWLAVCFAAASVGSVFEPGAWYAELNKPSWNPPNWLFAPVWFTLYVMMGVAAWRVWREGGFHARAVPLGAFTAQLGANAMWTWLFFGLHNPLFGFLDLIVLWVLLAVTIRLFWGVCRIAAGLLLPYFVWVTFASYLNFTVWRLNP